MQQLKAAQAEQAEVLEQWHEGSAPQQAITFAPTQDLTFDDSLAGKHTCCGL